MSFQKMNFTVTEGNNSSKHVAIWTIIKLEEDIIILNNVTKFHKILIKTIHLREQKLFETMNVHKQRAIALESIVQYGP